MQLTYLHEPVGNVTVAAAFYTAALGWDLAWHESDDTIAVWMPGHSVQIMLSTTDQPAGPMYAVDDLTQWISAHPDVPITVDPYDIPGGSVGGFLDAADAVF